MKKPFKKPKRRFYFGKIRYGTPYFYPRWYEPMFITIRKTHPFVSRGYQKILGYYVKFGSPIWFKRLNLGWKDKWGTPRYEWAPGIYLFFFRFQFIMTFEEDDTYWEMYLWWKYYNNEDIDKAKETWQWEDRHGNSTWNDKYLELS